MGTHYRNNPTSTTSDIVPHQVVAREYYKKNSRFEDEETHAFVSIMARYFEENEIDMELLERMQEISIKSINHLY